MRASRELWRLASRDRLLLLKSVTLVILIRLGLHLLPFSMLLRMLGWLKNTRTHTSKTNPTSVRRIAWAVTVASRRVPDATCLTQALAIQVLLGRLGYATALRIGVAKDPQGQLEAHAWVERDGAIVIGRAPDLSRYRLLSRSDGEIS
jgi:hypothetical protein